MLQTHVRVAGGIMKLFHENMLKQARRLKLSTSECMALEQRIQTAEGLIQSSVNKAIQEARSRQKVSNRALAPFIRIAMSKGYKDCAGKSGK
jgi:hypothetical protein